MNLLNIRTEETNVNLPKFTDTTFVLRNNYYVVHNGEVYSYYPIKVLPGDDNSPLIRFERCPPVMLEGYVIVGRKIYIVPIQDLQRKIIRKSREIQREVPNATDPNSADGDAQSLSTVIDAVGNSAVSASNKQGSGNAITVEERQAADAAWQDQIRALLHHPDEEEGLWEVEDNP